MTTLSTQAIAVVAILCALWLIAAVTATVVALRRAAAARRALERTERLATLIGGAPAVPLLVAADGSVDAPERLRQWLGLQRAPDYLAGLVGRDTGLAEIDVQALEADVAAASRAGGTVSRIVRVTGSQRVLRIEGRRSPAIVAGPGGVILWFFDVTGSEEALALQRSELERRTEALAAMSAIIEAAPFPMWHRGADLRLTLVNGAYVRAVEGESAADVVARGLELVETQAGLSPIAAAAAARERGKLATRTVPAIVAGERRTLRIVDVPLGDAGVAGFAVDIEELEQAHAALGRFARAQRDMLDRLSAGVAQFAPDRGLVFFNQPFVRLFELKPEWLADRPEFDRVLERMREADRLPESRDFPGWKAERRNWFTTATAQAIEENWLIPGGAHLRVVAQPLPDGGLLLIFEDRTEQVKLASARDTLLRVRTATFDNLFEAIGVFQADGRLHLWNSRFRELWGLEESLLASHPRVDTLIAAVASRLANPARADRIRELVRGATIERQQRSGRIAFADGRHLEFAAVPLPDGNALFTLLDITDSRRIEAALRERAEALEAADRVKTAFVANMSYELRTPLTSIQGFAEMLQAGYAGPVSEQGQGYVRDILEASARLGALIDDVLDLTQSQASALPAPDGEIDIPQLARELAAEIAPAAAARQLDFVPRIDPAAGTVRGEAKRLREALDQLLRNAVAYTPGGGRVLLHVAREGDSVVIAVSDNGIGIAPGEKSHLFDRFRQREDGAKARGLGLPFAKESIEQHGGSIALESEPGQGTTVTIRLPRVAR